MPAAAASATPDLAAFRLLARDRRVIPVDPPAAGRRRDPGRAVPQARPASARARSCWSPPSTAGSWSRYSFVGVRVGGDADRARRRRRSGPATPPVGVPTWTATRWPRCATRVALLHTAAAARPAAADRRHGRLPRLRRRPPARAAARHRPRTTCTCPSWRMLLATDLAVLDHDDGTVLLIANAVNYDATDERVDEAWADAVRGSTRMDGTTSPSPSAPLAVDLRLGRTGRPGAAATGAGLPGRRRARPRRRSAPARPSRSCCPSGSTCRRAADRARHLPGAARDQPEPVHVPAARLGRRSTWSGPARRRWSRSPAAGAAAPDRRHPLARRDPRGGRRAGARSCSPTRRSAPST